MGDVGGGGERVERPTMGSEVNDRVILRSLVTDLVVAENQIRQEAGFDVLESEGANVASQRPKARALKEAALAELGDIFSCLCAELSTVSELLAGSLVVEDVRFDSRGDVLIFRVHVDAEEVDGTAKTATAMSRIGNVTDLGSEDFLVRVNVDNMAALMEEIKEINLRRSPVSDGIRKQLGFSAEQGSSVYPAVGNSPSPWQVPGGEASRERDNGDGVQTLYPVEGNSPSPWQVPGGGVSGGSDNGDGGFVWSPATDGIYATKNEEARRANVQAGEAALGDEGGN